MAVKKTGNTALILSNIKYFVATLLNRGTDGSYTDGDSYIFEHILRDTVSMQQDDNETTSIENEVSDDPIKEMVSLGKWQLAATIEDVQKDLLVDMCGFSEVNGKILAPATYSERFARVAAAMETGELDTNGVPKLIAFVMPKVQLNTRIIFESLRTSLAGFNLAGTGKNIEVGGKQTPFYVEPDYTLPTDTTGA